MRPDQVKRLEVLEALEATAAPCPGCLREDHRDAQFWLDFLAPESIARRDAIFATAVAGLERDPRTQVSEHEYEQMRVTWRAEAEVAGVKLQKVLRLVPLRSGKVACPSCERRKDDWDACESLSRRMILNREMFLDEERLDPEEDETAQELAVPPIAQNLAESRPKPANSGHELG